MKMLFVLAVAAAAAAATDHAVAPSPYAGQQTRSIKALSDREIDEYLSGHGLGYARAAELNHYPGPRHVLDLAQELELSTQQTARTRALAEAVRAEAIALGRRLVDKERELDRQFAEGSVTADSLSALVAEIARIQGALRRVHLSAHLAEREVLSAQQRRLYDQLRGYGAGTEHAHDVHR